MKYMLDTNICIYAIKQKPESVLSNLKKHLTDGLCISSITLAELRLGVEKSQMKNRNAAALIKLLALFRILPFDNEAAVQFGAVCADLQKKGTPIGPMDTLIASHAKSCGMTLVTNNTRHFEHVEGLKLANWAES